MRAQRSDSAGRQEKEFISCAKLLRATRGGNRNRKCQMLVPIPIPIFFALKKKRINQSTEKKNKIPLGVPPIKKGHKAVQGI